MPSHPQSRSCLVSFIALAHERIEGKEKHDRVSFSSSLSLFAFSSHTLRAFLRKETRRLGATVMEKSDRPFDQKTRLVDRCGKWKASKPKWEFPYGICRSIYSSKRSIPKGLELVRKSEWDAQFPFGNSVWEFWPTFQEIPFPPENFHLGRLNKSFHLHSN